MLFTRKFHFFFIYSHFQNNLFPVVSDITLTLFRHFDNNNIFNPSEANSIELIMKLSMSAIIAFCEKLKNVCPNFKKNEKSSYL